MLFQSPKAHILPVAVLISFLGASPVTAQDGSREVPDFVDEGRSKAKMLLLGTFHFRDAGLNDYKPKHQFDVFSPEGQRQIEEVVAHLAEYRPTKVAVEAPPTRQPLLDSLYREYVAGNYELEANEIDQLGFRLARRSGHERVYAVDAGRNEFFHRLYRENRERIQAGDTIDAELDERFRRLFSFGDSVKTVWGLREYYLYYNSSDHIRTGNGANFIGSLFKLEGEDGSLGPDLVAGWFNRNLRIFRNLQRITDGPDERILLVIGGGHLPILRHAVRASPEYEIVEVERYLGAARDPADTTP